LDSTRSRNCFSSSMFQSFPLGMPFYFLPDEPIRPTPPLGLLSECMHARWRQEVVETALRVVASTSNPSSSFRIDGAFRLSKCLRHSVYALTVAISALLGLGLVKCVMCLNLHHGFLSVSFTFILEYRALVTVQMLENESNACIKAI
jgi:hypothetical protein